MQKNTDKYNNCFNTVRIFAAFLVFFWHGTMHLKLQNTAVLMLAKLSRVLLPGVPVFFILSGFVVWNSLDKCDDFKCFVKKRVRRIFPCLWLGVLVNALVMLVLYGENIKKLPFVLYQLFQASVLQIWTPDFLRGYGCGTPNGSLWTIPIMLQCYLVLWCVHKFVDRKGQCGCRKRCVWLGAVLIAALFVSVFSIFLDNILPEIPGKVYSHTFLPYIWLFLTGSFICEAFDTLVDFLKRLCFLPLILIVIAWSFDFDFGYSYGVVNSVFLACFIVGFAYRFPFLNIKRDISYGIYIFHMIVINALIELGFVGNTLYLVLSLALTLAISGLQNRLSCRRQQKYL